MKANVLVGQKVTVTISDDPVKGCHDANGEVSELGKGEAYITFSHTTVLDGWYSLDNITPALGRKHE